MMQQLSHLVGKNLSMGIDAESASVTELTPRQLCIAATTAFNRGVEVLLSALSGLSQEGHVHVDAGCLWHVLLTRCGEQ